MSTWNEAGRAYHAEYSRRLARYYGWNDKVELDLEDPRSRAQGDEVVRAVIELNQAGQWQRARELYDPAYSPLLGWIEKSERQLGSVAMLGPDDLLVRWGAPWHAGGMTYRLSGGTASLVDDVCAVGRSRNRDHLVLARAAGLEVRDARAALESAPIATLPWPERSRAVEHLDVSDDGKRVVVSCYRQGVLLASLHAGEPPWTVLPNGERVGDANHGAISCDGTRVAWGCQDAGHFLGELTSSGAVRTVATIDPSSEYPNQVCFSDDGRYTALSSRRMYRGVTLAFDWGDDDALGFDDDEREPARIDETLRVYAARWLDKSVVDAVCGRSSRLTGAFLLAGAGVMKLSGVHGETLLEQDLGSSVSSIDFCPESKLLAVATHAGFVHLFASHDEERAGLAIGYRARRELSRWVMWEQLPDGRPIRW